MQKAKKTSYLRTFEKKKRLLWYVNTESEFSKPNNYMTDIIYYNQKLAMECNGQKIARIATQILHDEFSEKIEDVAFYNLLIYVLTNKLCTMQSIKNVLSYKKDKNIKEIQDVSFNNGEVQLTCLI